MMTAGRALTGAIAIALLAGACQQRGPRNDATADASRPDTAVSHRPGATDCGALPGEDSVRKLLAAAPNAGNAGGLFGGRAEWAALVNRAGQICVVVAPSDSVGGRWPGSRSIAMAKAFTANGFSTDTLPLSTARLYTLTQPGHSLWGVGAPEPFDPECLDPSSDRKICGGAIAFGGGVPLYSKGRVIGGLGISGDTPCADHEIAKRIRGAAALAPAGGNLADDITYAKVDHASIYTHPLCPNTWRNGQKIGDEPPASGY